MTKIIQLSGGKGEVLINDEDYEYLSQFSWFGNRYARRYVSSSTIDGKQRTTEIMMHRELLNAPAGLYVDHINFNKLDNRRENLRLVTPGQNSSHRRKRAGTTSDYKGVTWSKKLSKWKVTIGLNARSVHLGYFDCPIEGAKAYNKSAIENKEGYDWLNKV